jgi:hypothetical protein
MDVYIAKELQIVNWGQLVDLETITIIPLIGQLIRKVTNAKQTFHTMLLCHLENIPYTINEYI